MEIVNHMFRGSFAVVGDAYGLEVFYGTQYHPVPPVEKDSYAI
jgi:hypothetical protein